MAGGDTSGAARSPPEELAGTALAYVASLRRGPGMYAERQTLKPDLVGASLAVAARHVTGALELQDFAEERGSLAKALHRKQDPASGVYEGVTRDTPSAKRLNLPLFGWAIRALAMLGERPLHPVKSLGRWDDPEELGWWLGLLDWHRSPRLESMRVMNVGVPRVVALGGGRRELRPSVHALFAWLRSRQDAASGLWGAAGGGGLAEGLGATFHLFKIYEAAGHAPPRAGRIARTVIDLCRGEEGWGGAWKDMVALGLLLGVAPADDELAGKSRDLARAAAERAAAPVLEGAPPAGAAPFPSLSDAVLHLETLRSAALVSGDETWAAAREWRSAWDPSLWVCDW